MRISDWSSDVCSGTLPNRRILLMSCRPLALFFLAATALLSACGDGKDGNNEQAVAMRDMEVVDGTARSEEHTSELQSLMRISYAVICLKKKIYTMSTHPIML